MSKVAVAMSGGVDSSVTAALLKKEGHEVIGITMKLAARVSTEEKAVLFDGCCGVGAVTDARKVAQKLGITHYVLDLSDMFAQKVIADFCLEYGRGKTPNPCIRCNQHIKFGGLLNGAIRLGAKCIATGHYARIDNNSKRFLLKKGIDSSKDQSYVLYMMTQYQLAHTIMPLGNLTKQEVRQMAQDFDLSVAGKEESQEICFVPDDDYRGFITRQTPRVTKPGPILNQQGKILGEHDGIINYTIGQRHGLGIAASEPLYVLAIEAEKNAVIVGPKDEVFRKELVASEINWISPEKPVRPFEAAVKIRYRHKEAKAFLTPLSEDRVHIEFERPQMAITPGQAAVFYQGETVVGGGTIE